MGWGGRGEEGKRIRQESILICRQNKSLGFGGLERWKFSLTYNCVFVWTDSYDNCWGFSPLPFTPTLFIFIWGRELGGQRPTCDGGWSYRRWQPFKFGFRRGDGWMKCVRETCPWAESCNRDKVQGGCTFLHTLKLIITTVYFLTKDS